MRIEIISQILEGEVIYHPECDGGSIEELSKRLNIELERIIKCMIVKNLQNENTTSLSYVE